MCIYIRIYQNTKDGQFFRKDFKYTLNDEPEEQLREIDKFLATLEYRIKAALNLIIAYGLVITFEIEIDIEIDSVDSPIHLRYEVHNPAADLDFWEDDIENYGSILRRLSNASALEAYRVTQIEIRRDLYKALPLVNALMED